MNSLRQASAKCQNGINAAGNYYLADGTYRHAGTTNVNPGLLADIRTKTTYPPTSLTGDFGSDTTLYPRVLRDTTPAPDIGYHKVKGSVLVLTAKVRLVKTDSCLGNCAWSIRARFIT